MLSSLPDIGPGSTRQWTPPVQSANLRVLHLNPLHLPRRHHRRVRSQQVLPGGEWWGAHPTPTISWDRGASPWWARSAPTPTGPVTPTAFVRAATGTTAASEH